MRLTDFKKELADLPRGSVALIISNAEDTMKTNIEILKFLTQGQFGLYITVNQPYSSLVTILKNSGVKTENLFFIDCITKIAGGETKDTKNCFFINSPNDLTELGIVVTQALSAMPESDKFIFMDSLSTLLVYNSSGTMAKFSHFLISKIKILKLDGIFMSIEEELNKKLIAQISQFCDKVIRVKNNIH